MVWAAEKGSFSVRPAFSDVKVDSETKQSTIEIEIDNQGQKETVFNISVVDFGSMDETGGLAFITVNDNISERKYALASWISLEKEMVEVMPGKTEKIKATILNKNSLSPGGHYGAILVTAKSNDGREGETVGINQSMASLVYVLKSGGEKSSLQISSVEVKNNFFKFPDEIKLRFWNEGNIHVVPRGIVEIKDGRGRTVAKGVINEGSVRIFPESYRIVDLEIKRLRKWSWPGKYKMEVNYRYDGKETFSAVQENYWYVGYEGVLLGGGLGLIIVVICRKKA